MVAWLKKFNPAFFQTEVALRMELKHKNLGRNLPLLPRAENAFRREVLAIERQRRKQAVLARLEIVREKQERVAVRIPALQSQIRQIDEHIAVAKVEDARLAGHIEQVKKQIEENREKSKDSVVQSIAIVIICAVATYGIGSAIGATATAAPTVRVAPTQGGFLTSLTWAI